jgi:hypothetical protein
MSGGDTNVTKLMEAESRMVVIWNYTEVRIGV